MYTYNIAMDLLNRMLEILPEDRISLEEISKHEWMT
jgi:serine/threonine protein kinase